MTNICEAPVVRSARRLSPRPTPIRFTRGDQAGRRGDRVALSNRHCTAQPSAVMTNTSASPEKVELCDRLLLSVSTMAAVG